MNEQSYKTITLPSGHVVLVDEEDYERVKNFKWRCHAASQGTLYVVSGHANLRLCRVVTGAPHSCFIRYANGDTLDNRKKNLVVAERYDRRPCAFCGKVQTRRRVKDAQNRFCNLKCNGLYTKINPERLAQHRATLLKATESLQKFNSVMIVRFLDWSDNSCAYPECTGLQARAVGKRGGFNQWNLCTFHAGRFKIWRRRQASALKQRRELNVSA